MPETASYDVFLSHNSRDKKAVEEIAIRLSKENITPFLDRWCQTPGVPWQTELREALDNSAKVLVFIGPHETGPWHHHEMQLALQAKQPGEVIPVLLPGGDDRRLPEFLKPLPSLDLRKGDKREFQRLVAAIHNKLVPTRKPLERSSYKNLLALAAALMVIGLLFIVIVALQTGSNDEPGATDRSDAKPTDQQIATRVLTRMQGLPCHDVFAEILKRRGEPTGERTLSLDFAIVGRREGESDFHVLMDGAELTSGTDEYIIVARPYSDGYMYIFQVDSHGKITWLFPDHESEHSWGVNPVNAGAIIQVRPPESQSALFLDEQVGIEHVSAVFTPTRWKELERLLEEHSTVGGSSQELSRAPVDAPFIPRGYGGTVILSKPENVEDLLNLNIAGQQL